MSERWTWEQLMACAGDVAIADADMDRRPPPGDLVARMLMQAAVTERALAQHRAWLVEKQHGAHTYASENADYYCGFDAGIASALADLDCRLAQGEG